MINVTCQACGKGFKLRDELAGREGKCPCGSILAIPSLGHSAIPASAKRQSVQLKTVSAAETKARSARQDRVASDAEAGFRSQSATRGHEEHTKPPVADTPKESKPRSKKLINIIAGVAILLIIGGVVAEILFVTIPDHRKMQATLDSTVKQYDKIDAMRDKAMKQQIAQNDAALAAATAQQSGSITGEVWVENNSGETLSIAGETVYLFPLDVKTDGPSGKFQDGIKTLQLPVQVAADLPGNDFAAAGAEDAKKNLEPLKPFMTSPTAPSITVISASIALTHQKTTDHTAKKMLDQGDSSMMESSITDEPFWKLMTAQSINTVETGRDGKFVLDDCPPGKYVLACRAFKPTLSAVVYWGQAVEVKPGKATKVDLTSSNAIVISY